MNQQLRLSISGVLARKLAHLKEREHDKAFYALCEHMEPAYHQIEFDLRMYLTQLDLSDEPVFPA